MYKHELTAIALLGACLMGTLSACDARGLSAIVAGVQAAQVSAKAGPVAKQPEVKMANPSPSPVASVAPRAIAPSAAPARQASATASAAVKVATPARAKRK
jgi:hypothetical protein